MENKKILIIGASGMAGHMITLYLKSMYGGGVKIVSHSPNVFLGHIDYLLDVYDSSKLREIISNERSDFVINCVGVLILGSKRDSSNAIYVNAYFPHLLSDLVHSVNPSAQVIHISTDCVFSGKKGNYCDNDEKDAIDVYGMTKNLGELINCFDLTLRTSIIGPEIKEHGEGLLHWFLTRYEGEEINGYEKSIWSGITTLELAKCIYYFIENKTYGLFQISNNIAISKYDLLMLCNEIFGKNVFIKKVDGIRSDKSILSTEKNGKIVYNVGSYKDMLLELFEFMKNNRDIYEQYSYIL